MDDLALERHETIVFWLGEYAMQSISTLYGKRKIQYSQHA